MSLLRNADADGDPMPLHPAKNLAWWLDRHPADTS
jgi:hypothetical protein